MLNQTHFALFVSIAILAFPAQAQSLKEKAGFGGSLSAAEATAIHVAEINFCEQRSSEFRSQAAPHLARFRANPRYQELQRNPEFVKALPEATALVQDRQKAADPAGLCKATLDRIKQ